MTTGVKVAPEHFLRLVPDYRAKYGHSKALSGRFFLRVARICGQLICSKSLLLEIQVLMGYDTRKIGRIEVIFVILALFFTFNCTVATFLVLFSDLPPVFNEKIEQYRVLNLVLAAGLLTITGILAASALFGWWMGLTRMILLGFIFLVSLDTLLIIFDNTVISVPNSPLQSAFRNVRVGNTMLYLPQPTAISPFGFRIPRAVSPRQAGYNILFLGNSYVHGSGSSFAVNYPQAAEADLQAALPQQKISLMSAGIDGFGINDDRVLYQYLIDQGYHFDLVVVNIMMGSDPTNDIPGTVRRAIAGQPQRLQKNWYVQLFYPINTYIFRYAVYFYVTFNQRWTSPSSAVAAGGVCNPSQSFLSFSRERAMYYYGPGARTRLFIDYNMDELDKIGQLSATAGAKLMVVLLPDPNALLPQNRQFYANVPMDWDWTRRAVINRIGAKWPTLDMAPAFFNRSDLFRCGDTHWNDQGNLAGATQVAEFIARDVENR